MTTGEELLGIDFKDWLKNHYTSQIRDDIQAKKFGDWNVDINGDLDYKGWYNITHERLTQDDWMIRLMEKNWFIWHEFMPAYFQACKNAGIQFVKIKIFY